MFDLRSRLRLCVIAMLFIPSVIDLIHEDHAVHLLAAVILGTLLGRQLRPLARKPAGPTLITLGSVLVWLSDVVLTDLSTQRLVNLVTMRENSASTSSLIPDAAFSSGLAKVVSASAAETCRSAVSNAGVFAALASEVYPPASSSAASRLPAS